MSKDSTQSVRECFGQRVRDMRHDRSISQEELAAIAGVNRTYIGMVERGEKNVTIVTLLRLAEALGARPADLLEGIHLGK
jgi:transcriptional regulator with XRE-family HTH domain